MPRDNGLAKVGSVGRLENALLIATSSSISLLNFPGWLDEFLRTGYRRGNGTASNDCMSIVSSRILSV